MAMINKETGEVLQGRPTGARGRPILKASMAPAFLALARTVTLEDPIELQKAANYLIKLAAHLQSDEYEVARAKKNATVHKSRRKSRND